MEDTREEYYQLVEDSDSKLEEDAPVDTAKEEKHNLDSEMKVKQDKKLMDSLSSQVEMFTVATSASIDKVANEVKTMDDDSVSAARISTLQSLLYTLDGKLDGHFHTLVKTNLSADCFTHCHSSNCTCSPLFYQCHIGGCIPMSKVCDSQYY